MAGLYIHIPFCRQACSYCDFYFVTRTAQMQAFTDALIHEIDYWKNQALFNAGASTIYFGGGTPSRLKLAQWEQIFNALSPFLTSKTTEITVEVNPDDVTEEYLHQLKDFGVTRLSMGVQTFNASLLKFMHRAHTADQAKKALEIIEKIDFKSFTVDLIYGNPGQTLKDLEKDLDEFLRFNLPHISAYSLTIEPKTRLGKAFEKGKIKPLDDEQVSEHFLMVRNRLEAAGFEAYEVSNFAKKGHRSQHNSNYWKHVDYVGLGPGAHSFIWQDGNRAERWTHVPDLATYVKNPLERTDVQVLDLKELAEERLLISLRTKEGIELEELKTRYQFSFSEHQKAYIDDLVQHKWAIKTEERISLTTAGLLLADHIVLELITR